jgi:hypothetical protein
MGAEPKAPEADVKARAQDTVDNNVARNNIVQLDPDVKKGLKPAEPTKDAAEPNESPTEVPAEVTDKGEEVEDTTEYVEVDPGEEDEE